MLLLAAAAPYITAQEPAPLAAAEQRAAKIIMRQVKFNQAGIDEVMEYIRVLSRDYDPDKKGVVLLMRPADTPKQARITLDMSGVAVPVLVREVAKLAGTTVRFDDHAIVFNSGEKIAPGVTAAVAQSPHWRRAHSIMLPNVQFMGATIEEAAEFLTIKSRQLDPDRKGVRFAASPKVARDMIQLFLRDVPVSEVASYTAEFCDLRLIPQGDVLMFDAR